jgi:hypothetical protein
MTFSKASRLPVLAGILCLLLMGFAGASYGAIRFDVIGSPTEVINTGRSEVTGSVTLYVKGPGPHLSGTANGGSAQIALTYTDPAMQIDNTTTSGIRMFFTSGFLKAFTQTAASGTVGIVEVRNITLGNQCVGTITINLAPGATPVEGDFIRIEGVRGRIDATVANQPGLDLNVYLQSVNDPAANQFEPDKIRVAKSFPGMNIDIKSDAILLCFPTTGKPVSGTAIPAYSITISEGFPRAFVGLNSATGAVNDRVDTGGPWVVGAGGTPAATTPQLLGKPTQGTQFIVSLTGIPASVKEILWDATVTCAATGAQLVLVADTVIFDSTSGTALAKYEYVANNQTGASDTLLESFTLKPLVVLKAGNQTATGEIKAAVTLAPTVACATGCAAPSSVPARPRFLELWQSKAFTQANIGCDAHDPFKLYCSVIRCQCFMLFTYATYAAGWNTGIVVANTTGDTAPFGSSLEAPDQLGKVTFYFYNAATQYRGYFTTAKDVLPGASYVDVVSNMLGTANMPDTTFAGYIIARADFQFCHGYAFIADNTFAQIAQGYLANVIPDPAIKGGKRTASAAGDITCLPAGESLNN